ncbi:MAG: nicotinate (nicotinamide) nucleotide adenylyltransferase [Phycisphaerales bacterium]|nr:nicotinate (nicotinamide) nucleotide adenylyltransferase [Phycisphaerales bacterium]
MTHILVFGGTFDPPHLAHIELARKAMIHLGCSKVIFVIAAKSPFKEITKQSASNHRLAMLELALAKSSWAVISTIELDRGGTSYTIDTLKSLQKQFGDETKLSLLIGADQAESFSDWYREKDIEKLATVLVLARDGSANDRFETLPFPTIQLSASQIRNWVREGVSIDDVVCPEVAAYIDENNLYK